MDGLEEQRLFEVAERVTDPGVVGHADGGEATIAAADLQDALRTISGEHAGLDQVGDRLHIPQQIGGDPVAVNVASVAGLPLVWAEPS